MREGGCFEKDKKGVLTKTVGTPGFEPEKFNEKDNDKQDVYPSIIPAAKTVKTSVVATAKTIKGK